MLANDLVHPDSTIERFGQVRIRANYSARPNDYVVCQTSIAVMTVTLPEAPTAGACIAVGDDDNQAATNPITIASAATIEGESSVTINQNGGVEVLIFNGDMWTRIATSQLVSASRRDIPVTPIALLRRALADASVSRIIDHAGIGQSANSVWAVGSFSSGPAFVVHRDLSLVGVNVFFKATDGVARSLKVSVWRSASGGGSGTLLGTQTFAGRASGSLHRLRFDVPITLTAVQALTDAFDYRIGVWETSGSFNPYTAALNTGIAWANNKLPVAFMMRSDVYFRSMAWAGGDARPSSFTSTEFYPVSPVFSDEVDA